MERRGGPRPAKRFHLYSLAEPTENNYQVRAISRPDYRTRLGLLARTFRRELIEHFGGVEKLDVIQMAMVDELVDLKVEVAELRARRAAGGISTLDSRRLGAASNSFMRGLCKLGFKEKAAVDRVRAEAQLMRAATPKTRKLWRFCTHAGIH